VRDKLS